MSDSQKIKEILQLVKDHYTFSKLEMELLKTRVTGLEQKIDDLNKSLAEKKRRPASKKAVTVKGKLPFAANAMYYFYKIYKENPEETTSKYLSDDQVEQLEKDMKDNKQEGVARLASEAKALWKKFDKDTKARVKSDYVSAKEEYTKQSQKQAKIEPVSPEKKTTKTTAKAEKAEKAEEPKEKRKPRKRRSRVK